MADYTPKVSQTAYRETLRAAPTTFPTATSYGSMPAGGGSDLLSGISSLMGGPAGMVLGGIGAVGSAINAAAQRKEEKRRFNTGAAIGDQQFAANYGLNRNQQWAGNQSALYDRERYAANQNSKLPMLQALVARLGGIAGGLPGLSDVAAPDMGALRGALNAPLGTYSPFTVNRQGHVKGASQYRNG